MEWSPIILSFISFILSMFLVLCIDTFKPDEYTVSQLKYILVAPIVGYGIMIYLLWKFLFILMDDTV